MRESSPNTAAPIHIKVGRYAPPSASESLPSMASVMRI